MKKKSRKPSALKSRGSVTNCVSARFVKDPYDVIQISAWDGYISLTKKEVFRLYEWLKHATEYLEAKEGK